MSCLSIGWEGYETQAWEHVGKLGLQKMRLEVDGIPDSMDTSEILYTVGLKFW